MKLSERLRAFSSLGDAVGSLSLNESKSIIEKARNENAWFTEDNIRLAFNGIKMMLEKQKLEAWANTYNPEPETARTVGVVMAGNIPLVGFHDFLCVLLSGNSIKIKLSSQDAILPKFIFKKLVDIEARFSERAAFVENLKGVDAMIATGSDNTARYFEFYFRNIPHIIRKNRSSCAVILGEELGEEFELLGRDIFSHFGLGCRNVSKLYVPTSYDFRPMFECWNKYEDIIHHNKYVNNYDYQKTIISMNREPFLDTGYVLLREGKTLVSPIAVLHYEFYEGPKEAKEKIDEHGEKLQLIASAKGWFPGSVPFGMAQFPTVDDYADRVDTMQFLTSLK